MNAVPVIALDHPVALDATHVGDDAAALATAVPPDCCRPGVVLTPGGAPATRRRPSMVWQIVSHDGAIELTVRPSPIGAGALEPAIRRARRRRAAVNAARAGAGGEQAGTLPVLVQTVPPEDWRGVPLRRRRIRVDRSTRSDRRLWSPSVAASGGGDRQGDRAGESETRRDQPRQRRSRAGEGRGGSTCRPRWACGRCWHIGRMSYLARSRTTVRPGTSEGVTMELTAVRSQSSQGREWDRLGPRRALRRRRLHVVLADVAGRCAEAAAQQVGAAGSTARRAHRRQQGGRGPGPRGPRRSSASAPSTSCATTPAWPPPDPWFGPTLRRGSG